MSVQDVKFNLQKIVGFSFEFFNMRRERRIHQTIPEGRQLIKLFSKEGTISDNVPTSYSPKRLKVKTSTLKSYV